MSDTRNPKNKRTAEANQTLWYDRPGREGEIHDKVKRSVWLWRAGDSCLNLLKVQYLQ